MNPTYVGGFVDVSHYPQLDADLRLNPAHVEKLLPLPAPIPLNVEHVADAEVGAVFTLNLTTHGLFCLGAITQADFLTAVRRLFSLSAVAQTKTSALPENPEAEMLHAWLPELSISALAPEAMAAAAENTLSDTTLLPFHHVALCAMGRRRGTVTVYGPSPEWVLDKFESLTKEERTNILTQFNQKALQSVPPLRFSGNWDILLAKAIDAGFLRNRMTTLAADRHVARVTKTTYLKASDKPTLPLALSSEPTLFTSTSDPAKAPGNTCNHAVPEQIPATGLSAQSVTAPATTSVPLAMDAESVTIPKAAFLAMLNTTIAQQPTQQHHSAAAQQLPAIPPIWSSAPPYTAPAFSTPMQVGNYSYGHAPVPYWGPFPEVRSGSPWTPDWESQTFFNPTGAHSTPGRGTKRQRHWDTSSAPVFPGEKPDPSSEFAALAATVRSIQRELTDLKSSQQVQQTVPQQTIPAQMSVPMAASLAAPTYYVPHAPMSAPPVFTAPPAPAPVPPGHVLPAEPTSTQTVSKPPPAVNAAMSACPPPVAAEEPRLPPAPLEKPAPPDGLFVDASSQPETRAHYLQRVFCEELLNKQ